MENTTKKLNEKTGVPNNIDNVAKTIFNDMNTEFIPYYGVDVEVNHTNLRLDLNAYYEIGKIYQNNKIKESGVGLRGLKIIFIFRKNPKIKEIEHITLKYNTGGKTQISDAVFKNNEYSYENNFIEIILGTPIEFSVTTLTTFLYSNKTFYLKSIAHELMHLFEMIKNTTSTIKKEIEYDISINPPTNIEPMRDFLFAVYYTHDFENYVRSVEVFMN